MCTCLSLGDVETSAEPPMGCVQNHISALFNSQIQKPHTLLGRCENAGNLQAHYIHVTNNHPSRAQESKRAPESQWDHDKLHISACPDQVANFLR